MLEDPDRFWREEQEAQDAEKKEGRGRGKARGKAGGRGRGRGRTSKKPTLLEEAEKPPTDDDEDKEGLEVEEPEPGRASQSGSPNEGVKRQASKTWKRRKSKRLLLRATAKKLSRDAEKADLPLPEARRVKRKLEEAPSQAEPGPTQIPAAQLDHASEKAAAQDRAKATTTCALCVGIRGF